MVVGQAAVGVKQLVAVALKVQLLGAARGLVVELAEREELACFRQSFPWGQVLQADSWNRYHLHLSGQRRFLCNSG